MAKKTHGNKKQPRLFVYIEGVTRDTFTLCGGPDVYESLDGLKRLMAGSVEAAMKNSARRMPRIQLRVANLTDNEVARLESL